MIPDEGSENRATVQLNRERSFDVVMTPPRFKINESIRGACTAGKDETDVIGQTDGFFETKVMVSIERAAVFLTREIAR